jgi:predicted unusual protein kinase regulating ubiquinone biosynthesis (AarF/ABC1/UbiB family)
MQASHQGSERRAEIVIVTDTMKGRGIVLYANRRRETKRKLTIGRCVLIKVDHPLINMQIRRDLCLLQMAKCECGGG